jgi:hypothetical protein
MFLYHENAQTSPLWNHAKISIELICLMASRLPLNHLESSRQVLRNFILRTGNVAVIPTKQSSRENCTTWWETAKAPVSELSTTRAILSSPVQPQLYLTSQKQDHDPKITSKWVIHDSKAKRRNLCSWVAINARNRLFSKSNWQDQNNFLTQTPQAFSTTRNSSWPSAVPIWAFSTWQERHHVRADSEATTLRVALMRAKLVKPRPTELESDSPVS